MRKSSPNFRGTCSHVGRTTAAASAIAYRTAQLPVGGNIIIECEKQLKNKINTKIPVFGPWVGLANPTVIELMTRVGFDFLLLDAEHFSIYAKDLGALLPAADLYRMPVIFRTTTTAPGEMKAALDAGATGIMVPMVEATAQARDIVAACRYAPLGRRGIDPWRGSGFYANFGEYMREANAATTLVVQIESTLGLASVEDIAAVEGVEALFAGPADLASSLGRAVGVMSDALVEALGRVARVAKAHGKIAAVDLTSVEHLPKLRSFGYSVFTSGSDVEFITQAGQRLVSDLSAASKD